jgi:hypothetical protein
MQVQGSIKLQTHRFLFSESFMSHLYEFSKIHQYDERKIFKKEWETWSTQPKINEIIEIEINRMITQGFNGDIIDKMFKSARYYFRKKSLKEKQAESEQQKNPEPELEEQKKPIKERIPKEWLKNMDTHIREQIKKNINPNTNISEIKPYDSFINYCNENKGEIYNKIKESEKQPNNMEIETFIEKIKKVYKNRFYKIKTTQ